MTLGPLVNLEGFRILRCTNHDNQTIYWEVHFTRGGEQVDIVAGNLATSDEAWAVMVGAEWMMSHIEAERATGPAQ